MAKPDAAATPKLEPPKPEFQPILASAMKLHESVNAVWRVEERSGRRPEQLENPVIWTTVAGKLRPFDLIQVAARDYWAELLVVTSEKSFAPVVKLLRAIEYTGLPENQHTDIPAGFRIDFDNLTNTYRAFRIKDGVAMTPPLPTREAVRGQLVNHATLR